MSIGRDNCSPGGAITRESPGTRKTYAGKYGELTPLRQRGGGGFCLPLTHYGRRFKVKATNRQELEMAIQKAREFIM
uniref:Uncharacterized protein n=1 Tax=Candidatus Kentrum sp. SD TaxID=2126332 RepID=A0A451BL41_9GAMM|nr:MAG: hypothetical protein BECKSD772D_GA0070982_10332 [Candidatus Kentron sp. SD]